MTLAKVVCNLRNFYHQDAEATVEWIRNHYNEKSGFNWTPEGIRLAWELSEGFTPSLGLEHKDAKAKQKARFTTATCENLHPPKTIKRTRFIGVPFAISL